MSVMKGGDSADQHAQALEAEIEWCLAEYNVVINDWVSHSYDRHGADVTQDFLEERLDKYCTTSSAEIHDWAATRFASVDVHMMCRDVFYSSFAAEMSDPATIAEGRFSRDISFGTSIGEGVAWDSNLQEQFEVQEIYTATFCCTYDRDRQCWVERTGYPNALKD